jgi:hypothetical protein
MSSSRTFGLLSALLAATALSGCGDAPVIGYSYYPGSYTPGEHNASGDLPVIVHGYPFTAADQQAVVNAMQGNTFPPARFVLAEGPVRKPYYVVMAFNALPTATAYALCVAPQNIPTSPVQTGKRVALTAVLCRTDQVLAEASGTIAAGIGANDPAFRNGIGQFTLELFPPRNPYWNGNGVPMTSANIESMPRTRSPSRGA